MNMIIAVSLFLVGRRVMTRLTVQVRRLVAAMAPLLCRSVPTAATCIPRASWCLQRSRYVLWMQRDRGTRTKALPILPSMFYHRNPDAPNDLQTPLLAVRLPGSCTCRCRGT
jgi:hypothetical protein